MTNKNFAEIVDISNPYVYYPIFEIFSSEDELKNKAVALVKKEACRLSKIYIEEQKKV